MTLTNGAGTHSANGVAAGANATVAATNVANILAAPQNFYFNVHSSANPGGVLRGQLQ
jgi:hypothetical protein